MDILTVDHRIPAELASQFPWALLVGMATSIPGLGPPLGSAGASVGRCQLCGGAGRTERAVFHRNVGMLVLRRTYRIEADMCRACLHKKYWEFTGLNLLLGPWGLISLIMTPIYFFTNLAAYVGALYKMRQR